MRIAYLSDLHLEFEMAAAAIPFDMAGALAPAAGADLIVLAGDIDVGEKAVTQADTIARVSSLPVIYIAGNHEAYGGDLFDVERRLRQAAWQTDGRVLFLNCNLARFWFGGEPLVVLGATLWTDYRLMLTTGSKDDSDGQALQDQDQIQFDSGPFRPDQARTLHQKQRRWLDAQLSKLSAEPAHPKILVVTHHAPIPEALGKRGAVKPAAYASDLREEITNWPSLTWIHGHTHHRHTTAIGASQVVSAPRGYPFAGTADPAYVCGILEL